jgi:hypothetical protein
MQINMPLAPLAPLGPAVFMTILLSACLSLAAVSQSGSKVVAGQTRKAALDAADSCYFIQDWANARQQYKLALSDTSHNALEWNRLGFASYNLGKYDEALAAYTRAAANHPTPLLQPYLYSRMAMAHAAMNEREKALESLNMAVHAGYVNFAEMDTTRHFSAFQGDARFKALRDSAYAAAYPCMVDPKRHEFDFWIGEWDAYGTGTHNLAGHSIIQSASGGCMILENWTSARSPYTGKSMNFIDGVTGKWQQVWVGAEGGPQHVFVNGEYRDGAMRFEFEQTAPDGKKQKGRFSFFNQGPDQVRQLNETSDDDGKTWNTVYDFTYVRKVNR